MTNIWAVVMCVSQWAEQSLRPPRFRGSNPVIDKFLCRNYAVKC